MKLCKRCNKEKSLSEFYRDGKGYLCSPCKKCVKLSASKSYKKRKIAHRTIALNYYYRMQHEAILAYGGYKCACCGETEPKFLSLDHVNNDGAEHRRNENLSGATLYKWLKDNDYPDGFQVLCMNCNHGKMRNGGVCPHEQLHERATTIPKGSTVQADGTGSAVQVTDLKRWSELAGDSKQLLN